MICSTVMECSRNGVFPHVYFDLTLSSQNLITSVYSVYQQLLYDKIISHREKGMNYVQIANWLNKYEYKTPRGNTFRNNHVHSIVKKEEGVLSLCKENQHKVYQISV